MDVSRSGEMPMIKPIPRTTEREAIRYDQCFRALSNVTAQIVCVCDESGAFVDTQDQWQDFTGQTLDQMRGL